MTFLSEVAQQIQKKHGSNLASVSIIVPSRRALIFLKQHLKNALDNEYTIAPEMLTIEDWVGQITGWEPCNSFEALLMLFRAYQDSGKNPESFENFLNWGQPLLKDFEEISSFRAPAKDLFHNLKDIIELKNWSPDGENPGVLSAKYLAFYEGLYDVYQRFEVLQKEAKKATRGAMLKQACYEIGHYLQHTAGTDFYFVGFNAMSEAEQFLYKAIAKRKRAYFKTDTDVYYVQAAGMEAGRFIRDLVKEGICPEGLLKKAPAYLTQSQKQITHHSAPSNYIQGYIASNLLEDMIERGIPEEEIAVVLVDEKLLLPFMGTLPASLQNLNITMGLSLSELPLFQWVISYLRLWDGYNFDQKTFYHQDLERLLTQSVATAFFEEKKIKKLLGQMRKNNWIRVHLDVLELHLGDKEIFDSELGPAIMEKLRILFLKLRNNPDEKETMFSEQVYLLGEVFDRLCEDLALLEDQELSMKVLKKLFLAVASEQKLDLRGEPLKGVQLMGMLETRLLDFKHIIMLSVNEDLLPAARNYQSIIPADVARHFGMPDYTYQNAIYAYHFWRLMQRCEEAHFVSYTDALSSSGPSRFLMQMEWELLPQNPKMSFETRVHEYPAEAGQWDGAFKLYKSDTFKASVAAWFAKGISPSSLAHMISYPEQFYFQKLLGIREEDEVSEVAGHDVLGNVVHQALEELYKPYVGQFFPKAEELNEMKKDVKSLIFKLFEENLPNAELKTGPNVLKIQMAQYYVESQISLDLKRLEESPETAQGQIIALEEKFTVKLPFEIDGNPVMLTGNLDRLERNKDGVYHIIDYKTGGVEPTDLNLKSIEEVVDEKNNKTKALQLLCYAIMLHLDEEEKYKGNYKASIIPLKKHKGGLLELKINKDTLEIKAEEIEKSIAKIHELCDSLYHHEPNAFFDTSKSIFENEEY